MAAEFGLDLSLVRDVLRKYAGSGQLHNVRRRLSRLEALLAEEAEAASLQGPIAESRAANRSERKAREAAAFLPEMHPARDATFVVSGVVEKLAAASSSSASAVNKELMEMTAHLVSCRPASSTTSRSENFPYFDLGTTGGYGADSAVADDNGCVACRLAEGTAIKTEEEMEVESKKNNVKYYPVPR